MGLIKAVTSTAKSILSEIWEDYIYCDSLDNNTLMKKGVHRSSGGENGKAGGNVITDGSRIAVNAGQFMIIVENGRIVDFTAEEGGYLYNTGTEPSLFCGDLKEGFRNTVKTMKERFEFGGQPANDQRVYFINTKEILDNKFGFGNIPFRDNEFNMSIMLQGFGSYSFQIEDPILFYKSISANVADTYPKDILTSQMRTELQGALLPVFGELSEKGLHYDQLPQKSLDILDLLRDQLTEGWKTTRGIELSVLTFRSIMPDDESVDKIREMQESRVYAGDHNMLGARLGAAQANAMESASENPNGAMMAAAGVQMVAQNTGINANTLLNSEEKKTSTSASSKWTCKCGYVSEFPFCPMCGCPKPKPGVCAKCGFDFSIFDKTPPFCPHCGSKN